MKEQYYIRDDENYFVTSKLRGAALRRDLDPREQKRQANLQQWSKDPTQAKVFHALPDALKVQEWLKCGVIMQITNEEDPRGGKVHKTLEEIQG